MAFFLGEAVSRGISRVPNRTGSRGRVILVHSYTVLLRTLAGEGVDGGWLRTSVAPSRTSSPRWLIVVTPDDKVAMAHSNVFDLDCEPISGENHSDKIDIVSVDTNEFTID